MDYILICTVAAHCFYVPTAAGWTLERDNALGKHPIARHLTLEQCAHQARKLARTSSDEILCVPEHAPTQEPA